MASIYLPNGEIYAGVQPPKPDDRFTRSSVEAVFGEDYVPIAHDKFTLVIRKDQTNQPYNLKASKRVGMELRGPVFIGRNITKGIVR